MKAGVISNIKPYVMLRGPALRWADGEEADRGQGLCSQHFLNTSCSKVTADMRTKHPCFNYTELLAFNTSTTQLCLWHVQQFHEQGPHRQRDALKWLINNEKENKTSKILVLLSSSSVLWGFLSRMRRTPLWIYEGEEGKKKQGERNGVGGRGAEYKSEAEERVRWLFIGM